MDTVSRTTSSSLTGQIALQSFLAKHKGVYFQTSGYLQLHFELLPDRSSSCYGRDVCAGLQVMRWHNDYDDDSLIIMIIDGLQPGPGLLGCARHLAGAVLRDKVCC